MPWPLPFLRQQQRCSPTHFLPQRGRLGSRLQSFNIRQMMLCTQHSAEARAARSASQSNLPVLWTTDQERSTLGTDPGRSRNLGQSLLRASPSCHVGPHEKPQPHSQCCQVLYRLSIYCISIWQQRGISKAARPSTMRSKPRRPCCATYSHPICHHQAQLPP